jgi:hypothetical protein
MACASTSSSPTRSHSVAEKSSAALGPLTYRTVASVAMTASSSASPRKRPPPPPGHGLPTALCPGFAVPKIPPRAPIQSVDPNASISLRNDARLEEQKVPKAARTVPAAGRSTGFVRKLFGGSSSKESRRRCCCCRRRPKRGPGPIATCRCSEPSESRSECGLDHGVEEERRKREEEEQKVPKAARTVPAAGRSTGFVRVDLFAE